jgi:hypothetical protein
MSARQSQHQSLRRSKCTAALEGVPSRRSHRRTYSAGPDQLLFHGKMGVMIASALEVKKEIPNDTSA